MKLPSVRTITVHNHKSGLKCVKIAQNCINKTIYGSTVQEVRKKYAIFKQQIEQKPTTRITLTFLEWYEKWLQLYKSNVKENTFKNIKIVFQKYFLPNFAKKPLRSISSQDLQPIFNTLYKQAPRQCTIAYIQIKSCFEQAYKLNYIPHNPCLAVIVNKTSGNKGKGLTKEQQDKLLAHMQEYPNPINSLVLIYLNTGMRRNELLTLTQQDINRETNEIHIKGTKTLLSDRIIQTSREIINLIPNNTEKPFKHWSANRVNKEFKKLVDILKFDKITLHSLRHTFATNCVENGVDMVVLQKWLGHSSIKMTIDRYTHISEEYKQENFKKVKILT